MNYILGLDLGTSSIGWAIVRAENVDGEWIGVGLERAGVRIFEEGVLKEKGNEKSRSQDRRLARAQRRTHRRRNARRHEFKAILQNAGLLPKDSTELAHLFLLDPYPLRAKGLDEPLKPYELGRALYHLCQRRGFKSNRKGESKDDTKYKKDMAVLQTEIRESGYRTLGEFLCKHPKFQPDKLLKDGMRRREHRTTRAMYEHEFTQLWEKQRQSNPALTENLRAQLRDVLFYQHHYDIRKRFGENLERLNKGANAWRAPELGRCELEPEEKRCPRDLWIAQKFRILQETANLTVQEPHSRERPLTLAERKKLFDALMLVKQLDFDAVANTLELHPNSRFNLQRGERRFLKGNTIEHALASAFKKKWSQLPGSEKNVLRNALSIEGEEEMLRELLQPYQLETKQVTKLCELTIGEQYARYSEKAIRKLLPYMELTDADDKLVNEDDMHALKFHSACEQAGYHSASNAAVHDSLPALDKYFETVPEITNPVVVRALSETRKVVNAILREHGKPARIIVELAREMHGGELYRKEISKTRQDNQDKRDDARKELKNWPEFSAVEPSHEDIERYLLWKEQGPTPLCPYTGAVIGREILFTNSVEVDHILPRWRSLDDSYMNKVVCLATANADKGNNTPFENWHGTPKYDEIIQRVEAMRFPRPKLKRFYQQELEADAWATRYLNDTRYITTEVTKYLQLLFRADQREGQKAIGTTNGALTAELRRKWGLNKLCQPLLNLQGEPFTATSEKGDEPEKSRADHRHHAVDAIVVALSSRKHVKRYADYYKLKATRADAEHGVEAPWPTLREDAERIIANIIVSHRPTRGLAGALHKEFAYGAKLDKDGEHEKNKDGKLLYVQRVKLESLTTKDLSPENPSHVFPEEVRDLLKKRFDAKKGAKDWWKDLRMLNDVVIKRAKLMFPIGDAVALAGPGHEEPFKYVEPGGNHHLEIIRENSELKARIVSRWRAVERKSRNEPIIQGRNGAEFVLSLMLGDTVKLTYDGGEGKALREAICVVQQIGGDADFNRSVKVLLRDHRDARRGKAVESDPFVFIKSLKRIDELQVMKAEVDLLGRVSVVRRGRG